MADFTADPYTRTQARNNAIHYFELAEAQDDINFLRHAEVWSAIASTFPEEPVDAPAPDVLELDRLVKPVEDAPTEILQIHTGSRAIMIPSDGRTPVTLHPGVYDLMRALCMRYLHGQGEAPVIIDLLQDWTVTQDLGKDMAIEEVIPGVSMLARMAVRP